MSGKTMGNEPDARPAVASGAGGPGPTSGVGESPSPAGRVVRLAWLPVPLLLAAIIAARVAGLSGSHELHSLTLVLSFTFYTLVSLGTLYLIGRSFLVLGTPGLLLLECGVILWSLAGTVGDAVSRGDANVNVTIFNTGMLLAGLCHLASAVLAWRPQRPLRPTPLWLGAGCAIALGVLWLVTKAALGNWLPVFFIQGQGGTPVRYFVLSSATATFVLASGLLYTGQRRARPPFTSWYALALLMLAVGLFGVMIQRSLGSAVNWLGRTAQWLGGLYLLLAAGAALRTSGVSLLPHEDRSRPVRYRDAMALVMVLAAAAVRLTFLSSLGSRVPYLLFYLAVVLAAIYGGLRAGLIATALSALLVGHFLIPASGFFRFTDATDWLGLLIFVASGAMIGWAMEAMHRARARASAAETQALLAAEREAAAEVLRESEARYRNLFENMTEEVHFWKLVRDEEGRIKTWTLVDVNPPALKTWGKSTVQEIRGKTTDEIFGPGATDHYRPVVEKAMAEGVPQVYEDYFPNLDRHFRFTTVPLGDHFITTGADITSIKKANEALRRSEASFRSVLDNSRDVIYRLNLQTGGYEYISPSVEAVTGFSPAELMAQGLETGLILIHPDDLPSAKATMARLEETGQGEVEYRQRTKSGAYRWISDRMSLVRDGAGKPLYRDGVVRDVTGSKRAEEALRRAHDELEERVRERTSELDKAVVALKAEAAQRIRGENALRESEFRYRTLFESMDEAFCVVEMIYDSQGNPSDYRFVETNPAFVKHTGFQDGLGRTIRELVPEHDASWFEIYGKIARTGEACRFENHDRAMGRFYDVFAFRIGEADHPRVGILFKDITDQKRAEAALRERSEKLRTMASELTMAEQHERQRLARILHDGLQQLLVGAKFRLAALERTSDPIAIRVAEEVNNLLSDSIESSRSLTAELSPPILREGGLVAALEWLARWMQYKHELAVSVEAHDATGFIDEHVTVLLFHATRELLFNVVKHAGVRTARVQVTTLDDQVRISVADEGRGFDPARLSEAGGALGGFGLFSIRERIDLFGGRLEVDSAPGRGSRFTLIVPSAAPVAEGPSNPDRPSVAAAIPPPAFVAVEGTIRVVLVDDHIVVRQGLAGLLKAEADMAIVGEASDGESAMALIRKVRPDVVLMDISMPGMNGIEATRIIHAEMPEIRVIGLSMFEQDERADAMREAGAVDYLTKSGPSDALLAAIRRCVRG